MYIAAKTTLTLDDGLDLIEIQEVGRSWSAAEHRNADWVNAELQRRKDRNGNRH